MMMMVVMTMMMMILNPPHINMVGLSSCRFVGFRSDIIGEGSVRICEGVTYAKGRGRKWKAGPATMTSRAKRNKKGVRSYGVKN